MHKMRMGSSVTCSLREGQVLFTVITAKDSTCGKGGYFLGQQMRKVWALNFFWYLGFGFLRCMHDERFVFDERPLDTFFRTISLETLTILTRRIEQ